MHGRTYSEDFGLPPLYHWIQKKSAKTTDTPPRNRRSREESDSPLKKISTGQIGLRLCEKQIVELHPKFLEIQKSLMLSSMITVSSPLGFENSKWTSLSHDCFGICGTSARVHRKDPWATGSWVRFVDTGAIRTSTQILLLGANKVSFTRQHCHLTLGLGGSSSHWNNAYNLLIIFGPQTGNSLPAKSRSLWEPVYMGIHHSTLISDYW